MEYLTMFKYPTLVREGVEVTYHQPCSDIEEHIMASKQCYLMKDLPMYKGAWCEPISRTEALDRITTGARLSSYNSGNWEHPILIGGHK